MPEVQLRQVWGAELSMIFQDPMTALNPVKRIGRQITESLRLHLGMDRAEAKARPSISLLRSVGIPSPEERMRWYPFQLSGGMRQRVMIAIALACAPRLVMADEPTTGLDVTVQAQILDLLADLQRERHMAVHPGHPRPRGRGQPGRRDRGHVRRPDRRTGTDPDLVRRHPHALHPGADGLHPPAGRPERHPPARHRRTPSRSDPIRPRDAGSHPGAPTSRTKCRESEPPLRTAGSPDHLFACWFPLVNGRPSDLPDPQPARGSHSRGPEPMTDTHAGQDGSAPPGTGFDGASAPASDGASRPTPGDVGDAPVLLQVEHLVVEFAAAQEAGPRRLRRQLRRPGGRDPRAGGRIRLRQVDHGTGHRPGATCRPQEASGSTGPS